jgi:hypothetical protein
MTNKNKSKTNKGKKQPRSGARRSKQVSHSRHSGKPTVHLSMCAEHYARSLVNPYSGPLPCVPCYPPVKSRKVRLFSKGRFYTASGGNTPGFGWIMADPAQAAAKDAICVSASLASFTGSQMGVSNVNGATVTSSSSNSDYTASQIGFANGKASYRVVSAGLRVKYSGTILNAGGDIVGLQEPTHDTLNTYDTAGMEADDEAKKFAIKSDRWYNILYRPVRTQEKDFHEAITVGQDDLSNIGQHFYMGFAINSATPNQPFDYEFYVNMEFSGRDVRGATRSHSDPVGFEGVTMAIANSKHRLPRESTANSDGPEKGFLSEVGDFIIGAISWVGNAIGIGVGAFEKGVGMAAMVM